MRIKILRDYKGPLGRFAKDKNYELDPRVARQLPDDCFKELPPMNQNQGKKPSRKPEDNRQKAFESSPKDKQMRPEKAGGDYKTK